MPDPKQGLGLMLFVMCWALCFEMSDALDLALNGGVL